MQKVIQSNEFIEFKNYLNVVIEKISELKKEINEDIKEKYNLKKYEQIIEKSDSDILTQYETWYDQLSEFIYKEIDNNDEIKVTLNSIVYKMIDKETIIFNKQEQNTKNEEKEKQIEFNKENERLEKEKQDLLMKFSMEKGELKKESDKRKQKYNEKLKELNNLKHQYDTGNYKLFAIISSEENLNFVPSITKMKKWISKQHFNIIFDFKINGDNKGVLSNKLMNKKNLYFISVDNQNNVFGGYVDTIINKVDTFTKEFNDFVFSLIRNKKLNNVKYNIKKGEEGKAFHLNSIFDYLYVFGRNNDGYDVVVSKIGHTSQYICKPVYYEYSGEQNSLLDNTNKFSIKQVLVLEMN
ncbi:hypothetical protein QTN25_005374 [Entamoeba marina]